MYGHLHNDRGHQHFGEFNTCNGNGANYYYNFLWTHQNGVRYSLFRPARRCNYQLNSLFDSDFGVSVFMGAPSRFAYLHALFAILLFTWAEAAAAPMFTTRTIIGCASEYIDMRNHAARRFPRWEIMYGGEKISHIEFVILNVIPGARAPLWYTSCFRTSAVFTYSCTHRKPSSFPSCLLFSPLKSNPLSTGPANSSNTCRNKSQPKFNHFGRSPVTMRADTL